MEGRMWSSGRGSGSRSCRERDPERERRVRVNVVDFNAVAAAIAERSVREEAERRHHAAELEALQWQQAVAANEKAGEWHHIRVEQVAKYVDLCSSDEED
ncbi:CDPK-related protein kinase [Hordeum vulgare]|nr:CDPK-related protein kinase [Hordeum vulgare]